eukprot:6031051-Pleurochrysis_carterae.AAC.1
MDDPSMKSKKCHGDSTSFSSEGAHSRPLQAAAAAVAHAPMSSSVAVAIVRYGGAISSRIDRDPSAGYSSGRSYCTYRPAGFCWLRGGRRSGGRGSL